MSVSLFSNSWLSINCARNGGTIKVIDSSIGMSMQYFVLHELSILIRCCSCRWMPRVMMAILTLSIPTLQLIDIDAVFYAALHCRYWETVARTTYVNLMWVFLDHGSDLPNLSGWFRCSDEHIRAGGAIGHAQPGGYGQSVCWLSGEKRW